MISTFCSVTESSSFQRRRKAIRQDDTNVRIESEPSAPKGYLSAPVLPFVLHLVFMAGTAFLVMHVQVSLKVIISVCFDYGIRTEHVNFSLL